MSNSDTINHSEVWSLAPPDAYHWERFPNGRCIWHCRADDRSYTKKAPSFNTTRNTSWRDIEKQRDADESKLALSRQLNKLNITLI